MAKNGVKFGTTSSREGQRMTGDRAFLLLRAEQEIRAAMRAAHPAARSAHLDMADAYLDHLEPVGPIALVPAPAPLILPEPAAA